PSSLSGGSVPRGGNVSSAVCERVGIVSGGGRDPGTGRVWLSTRTGPDRCQWSDLPWGKRTTPLEVGSMTARGALADGAVAVGAGGRCCSRARLGAMSVVGSTVAGRGSQRGGERDGREDAS